MSTELHTANLIHITPNAEALIAYLARVSSKDQANPNYTKLLRYLIKHNHWSPFEMANMCVEIITTRAIAPQILRHRSFCVGGNTEVYGTGHKGNLIKYRISDLADNKNLSQLSFLFLNESTGKFEISGSTDAWQSGEKPLYKMSLSNGFELELTDDHKFLTDSGWKTIQDGIDFNIAVLDITSLSYSPIASIEYLGIKPVYDISMANEFHNFVGNGIVLHNCFQELCLAGDAKIRIKGQKTDLPIAELYNNWDSTLELKCFDNLIGDYTHASIKSIFSTGMKPIYEYTDTLGNVLPCTEEHKVLTKQGFLPIEKAYQQGLEIGNANFMCPVFVALVEKRYRGNEQTYDIEMNHASHNYVANGFCVHNSQRYAKPSEAGAEPLPTLIQSAMETDWRLQDKKNRQNSIEPDEKKSNELANFTHRFKELAEMSQGLYDDMLEAGIAKECARGILPLNQPTRLYMNGTIRSWIHYLKIRTDSATQKEHRLIAQAIQQHFANELPVIAEVAF